MITEGDKEERIREFVLKTLGMPQVPLGDIKLYKHCFNRSMTFSGRNQSGDITGVAIEGITFPFENLSDYQSYSETVSAICRGKLYFYDGQTDSPSETIYPKVLFPFKKLTIDLTRNGVYVLKDSSAKVFARDTSENWLKEYFQVEDELELVLETPRRLGKLHIADINRFVRNFSLEERMQLLPSDPSLTSK